METVAAATAAMAVAVSEGAGGCVRMLSATQEVPRKRGLEIKSRVTSARSDTGNTALRSGRGAGRRGEGGVGGDGRLTARTVNTLARLNAGENVCCFSFVVVVCSCL